MRYLALLALVLAPSIPRPSGACSVDSGHGGDHRLDPAHATDVTPPGAVTADFVLFYDEEEDDSIGCNSCGGGDYSRIQLALAATDDRTEADRLAYTFAITAGQPPGGIDLPFNPRFTAYDGGIQLQISREDRDFAFQLEVRAVDLNGNVGAPTVITITSGK